MSEPESRTVRILVIGDVVGRAGRKVLEAKLKSIKSSEKIDFVIANAENAAGGLGLTEKVGQELFSFGIDVLTSGNHIWDRKEAINYLSQEKRLLRPANYSPFAPGSGSGVYKAKNGLSIGVLNLSGRIFMPPCDCPFRTGVEQIRKIAEKSSIIIVDFHAEATSEKEALGYYLDGQVSALVGTHTHVQTADEQILPKGTGYITDVGLTGPTQAVIGVRTEKAIERFITGIPVKLEAASGPSCICGVILDINANKGNCLQIRRLFLNHYS